MAGRDLWPARVAGRRAGGGGRNAENLETCPQLQYRTDWVPSDFQVPAWGALIRQHKKSVDNRVLRSSMLTAHKLGIEILSYREWLYKETEAGSKESAVNLSNVGSR